MSRRTITDSLIHLSLHCETEVKTDLLSPPVESTMDTLLWPGVQHIARDEYKKRDCEILNDMLKGRISNEECERRARELAEEVTRALGEPERRRPDNDSVLNTDEREVKQRQPSEYRVKWGELWREWEDGTIPSTREFWERWNREVLKMWVTYYPSKRFEPYSTSSRSQSHDGSHQPSVGQQEWYATQLEMMQAARDESHISVPVKIAQVTEALQSEHALSRDKRNQMGQTLESVRDTLGRGFKKMGEGIAALLRAVRDGLLPVTSGYKALQEHFDELLQGISQLSVLHDLASKAYSKGLITRAQKSSAFAYGMNIEQQANSFLEAIESRVRRDKKAFDKFVSILKSEPAYEHLVALVGAH